MYFKKINMIFTMIIILRLVTKFIDDGMTVRWLVRAHEPQISHSVQYSSDKKRQHIVKSP